jgi:hypothetical protein
VVGSSNGIPRVGAPLTFLRFRGKRSFPLQQRTSREQDPEHQTDVCAVLKKKIGIAFIRCKDTGMEVSQAAGAILADPRPILGTLSPDYIDLFEAFREHRRRSRSGGDGHV